MNTQLSKNTGIALLFGCLLLVVTMVLHPVGGSVAHLIKISNIIIISHSIAIASIPILLFGFWGLSNYLKSDTGLSRLAFCIMTIGLIAVMLAATVNGLVLPFFVNRFKEATPETIESIKPILQYNHALNHAFDYIFMGAACGAILLWSIIILRKQAFPKWFGYYGILLSLIAVVSLFLGVDFVGLEGFRIFSFGLVTWILVVGYFLMKQRNKS